MRILIIDNYDSFTYNLALLVKDITGNEPDVYKNDKITIEQVGVYDKILLSPGPGIPEEAGILKTVIGYYVPSKSILGVCLGLQAIGEVFGGMLVNLAHVYHGVPSAINIIVEDYLLSGLSNPFTAGRYHSWVVDKKTLPAILQVTAQDDAGYIMAIRHTDYDVRGVQFHPESILTPQGKIIISNWLNK